MSQTDVGTVVFNTLTLIFTAIGAIHGCRYLVRCFKVSIHFSFIVSSLGEGGKWREVITIFSIVDELWLI